MKSRFVLVSLLVFSLLNAQPAQAQPRATTQAGTTTVIEIYLNTIQTITVGTDSLIIGAGGQNYVFTPGALPAFAKTDVPNYLLALMAELRLARSVSLTYVRSGSGGQRPVVDLVLNYNALK